MPIMRQNQLLLGVEIHKDNPTSRKYLDYKEEVDLEYKLERPDSEIFFNQEKRLYGKGIVKVRVYYQ